MPIQCTIVPVTPYQQNCSIIKCEATGRGAIVDPGGDIDNILAAVDKMGATVEKIILTHAHMDHCAASDVLRQRLQVPSSYTRYTTPKRWYQQHRPGLCSPDPGLSVRNRHRRCHTHKCHVRSD